MIITFGDSFASGCELADHLLYLNYPFGDGGSEANDLDWLLHAKKVRSKIGIDLRQEETSRTFTAKLGHLLQVETENHGEHGTSQDAIFRSVVNRLSQIENPEGILVLVTITNPFRFSVPFNDQWAAVQLEANKKDSFNQVRKFWAQHGKEDLMIEQHLIMLHATMSYIKQRGFKTLLVDSVNRPLMTHLIKHFLWDKNPLLANGLELETLPLMADSVIKHGIKKPYRAGGHYTEEVHEAFAHDLIQEIGKQ